MADCEESPRFISLESHTICYATSLRAQCGLSCVWASFLELRVIFIVCPAWGMFLSLFPCFPLSLAYIPWTLGQMTKRNAYFFQRLLPFQLVQVNFSLGKHSMGPCDVWPLGTVVLMGCRLRNQAPCFGW